MDQESGGGHHAITYAAVAELFHSGLAVDGKIDGMTQGQYAKALDETQAAIDAWYGKTTHPAQLDGSAQCEHGLADPKLTGQQNLAVDQNYVENNLIEAKHGHEMTHLGAAVHAAENGLAEVRPGHPMTYLNAATDSVMNSVTEAKYGHEMTHLGAAAHALEDSYSEAHAWRGSSANQGDPTAPIESFNVFDPLPSPDQRTWGVISGHEGTHDARFDHVPVGRNGELIRGTDIAAAHAVAQTLITYYGHRHQDDVHAQTAIHETVGSFYQPSDLGVEVNYVYTHSWAQERDHRLELHEHEESDYHQDQLLEDHKTPPVHLPDPLDGGLPPGGLESPDGGPTSDLGEYFSLPAPDDHVAAAQPGDHSSLPAPDDHVAAAQPGDHFSLPAPDDHVAAAQPGDHFSLPAPDDHVAAAQPGDHLVEDFGPFTT